MAISLLRIPDVEKAVGLKKSYIYEAMNRGEFPPPVRLGTRTVAWRSDDIEEWIDSRPVVKK
jgi:prophage regulatory protein